MQAGVKEPIARNARQFKNMADCERGTGLHESVPNGRTHGTEQMLTQQRWVSSEAALIIYNLISYMIGLSLCHIYKKTKLIILNYGKEKAQAQE